MCGDKCCEKDKCGIAVTVEDDLSPCTFPENRFDIEIKSEDGCTEACGKVTGGSSAVFELPCGENGKEYSVTVTGGVFSSPRAQTRRVRCCCGETAGATFIFMTYEPCCEEPECCCPPPPPCCCDDHKPPKPPKPKKEHKEPEAAEARESGEEE